MAKSAAQLDREISAALAGGAKNRKRRTTSHLDTPAGRQPLYGHTSEATAYLVDDYPYGFRERTKIRYWLEHKAKKGWRFMSQTMNPKTQRWNKPKASTYTLWGAAMFLDGKGQVQWTGVGPYTGANEMLAFVRAFPGADMSELRLIVPEKIRLSRGFASGKFGWVTTVNGVQQQKSEEGIAKDRADASEKLAIWEEVNVYLDHAA